MKDGESRQELVFIGIEMDEKCIIVALDSALLTSEEMVAGA